MKTLIAIMLFTALAIYAAEPQIRGKAPRPKLVAVGNAGPTVDYLIENYQTVEKMLPADGTVVFLDAPGVRNGKPQTANRHSLFADWKWERKWFEPGLHALKKIKLKKLTDNFIYVAVTDARYDMFNDAAWEKVCHNIAVMAWYAREAGFKGIFFDIENYTQGYRALFQHDPNGKHSFSEAWLKARQRGREFMQAMAAEYPAITILTTYTFSMNFDALESYDPMQYLSSSLYGLLPAFYNGMFDVIPPAARLLDGTEHGGYRASGQAAFAEMCSDFYRKSPELLAESNLPKFFPQSGMSPGVFLDSYIYEKGPFVIKSPDMGRLALLRANLLLAMQCSDAYIWLYSEQCRWFPAKMADVWEKAVLKTPGKGRLWEAAMPGITQSIEFVRNPEAYVAQELAAGKLQELVNIDFSSDVPAANPADCENHPACKRLSFHQSSAYRTRGVFELDGSVGCKNKPSLKFTDIKWGSVRCHIPVKPGEIYFIRAASKAEEGASPRLNVYWRDAKDVRLKNYALINFSEPLPNGWQRGSATVIVPPGVSRMAVVFVNGDWGLMYPPEIKNVCWLDDLEVYKVPFPDRQ